MVQLGLASDFKLQVLQWDGTTVHMKESGNLLGKSDLTKSEMCEVVIQTAELASTWEATEIMVKTSTVPMQRQTYNRYSMIDIWMLKKELCYVVFSKISGTFLMELKAIGPLSLLTYN